MIDLPTVLQRFPKAGEVSLGTACLVGQMRDNIDMADIQRLGDQKLVTHLDLLFGQVLFLCDSHARNRDFLDLNWLNRRGPTHLDGTLNLPAIFPGRHDRAEYPDVPVLLRHPLPDPADISRVLLAAS